MIKIKKVFIVFVFVVLHNAAQGMKRDHEAEKRSLAIQSGFLLAVEDAWNEKPTKGSKDDFALSKTLAKKVKTEREVVRLDVKPAGFTVSRSNDENKFYQCSECPYSTGHANRAKTHSDLHALTTKGFTAVLQCPFQCGYLALDNRRMKEHLISHKTEKDFKCSVRGCGTKTKSYRSMKRHIQLVHPEES
jgi:hypothetical protein